MTASIKNGTGASPFTYQWSGCASGTAAAAACSVTALGNNSATVVVTDKLNKASQANATVQGTNSAPTGSAGGGGSCHPKPGAPCTTSVNASGSDGDSDTLSYSWSGCASGSATTASCSVASIGAVTATVTICDGWACGQYSVNSTGTNGAPVCSASGGGSCHPSGSSPYTCSKAVSASCTDPDGDAVTISWSGCASGTGASSSCTVGGISNFTATASGSDGWASSTSSVGANGTDSGLGENWGISPTYSGGAQTETKFQWNDADGDAIEVCQASCTDTLGLGCCTIVNCRTDTYGGSNGHVIYKQATQGPGGAACSMKLKVCTHWSCFNDNAGFTP